MENPRSRAILISCIRTDCKDSGVERYALQHEFVSLVR
jgi:hypothetical protein